MNLSIGTCSLFTSALILSGCATPPVLEQRLGQVLPNDASASYDAGSDTVTLGKGGASVILANNGTLGNAGDYQNPPGTSRLLYKTTASGKGNVFAFASDDTSLGLVGAIANRDAEVTVPTSGTAAFNGGYEGLIVRASDKNVVNGFTGTTCLLANFGASSISGSIINRTGLTPVMIPVAPLSASGVFGTVVTGGQFPGDPTAVGRVSGMFADVAGGEIVGVLQLDHFSSGQDYYEVGGFTTVAGAGVCP